MSFAAQAASWGCGTAGSLIGRNDQNFRPSEKSIPFASADLPSRGSGAPISIHFTNSAITPSESFPFGGIS
jgi:hypothetical protein